MRRDSLEAVSKQMLRDNFSKPGEGNLHAWAAIQFFLSRGEPLPEWVSEYLLDTSNKLLAINKPKQRAAQMVFEAIGIKGHDFTGSPSHYITCMIIEGMIRDGYTPAAAYRKHTKNTGEKVNSIKKHHLVERTKFRAFSKKREERKNRVTKLRVLLNREKRKNRVTKLRVLLKKWEERQNRIKK